MIALLRSLGPLGGLIGFALLCGAYTLIVRLNKVTIEGWPVSNWPGDRPAKRCVCGCRAADHYGRDGQCRGRDGRCGCVLWQEKPNDAPAA